MTAREDRLATFATFPQRLRAAPMTAEGRPTPPGEWGPAEIVRHLIAVEDEVHQFRLRQVAVEDDPHWEWTEPGLAAGFDGAQIGKVLEAFEATRASSVRIVRSLADAGWARGGTHATYGYLNVEGLLRLASDHDAEHLNALGG